MVRLRLVFAPQVERDLKAIHPRDAERILLDLEILERPPWPAGKTKPLKGYPAWEMKCGDFRVLFRREADAVRVLRVVNRRDLERTLRR